MIDSRFAPYGLLLLRVGLGVMFIAHALLKYLVFTPAGFEQFLGTVGFPTIFAWPVMAAEFVGGIAILFGFYSRIVTILLLPILLGALMVHSGNGWMFSAANGGWEYPAFLILASLVHIFCGEGAFALKPTPLALSGQAVALKST